MRLSRKTEPSSPIRIFVQVGVEMAVAIALCTLVGLGVDRYWQTAPWGVMVGFLLGAAAGIRNAYRAASSLR